MWSLVNIRNIAIRYLSDREDMTFTDKIIWGKGYKVVDRMITGYTGLVDRGEVVSLDEGTRIEVPGDGRSWHMAFSEPFPRKIQWSFSARHCAGYRS